MTDNGGLTVGERFTNMERTLDRIELKLDSKVDRPEFRELTGRVALLEAGETPLGRVLLEQFTGIQKQVQDLALHGSSNAQAAVKRLTVAEADIDSLRKERVAADTARATERELGAKTYRTWTLGISIVALLSMLISMGTAVTIAVQ